MTEPTNDMLLTAWSDGELDPLQARALESRMEREPELAARAAALRALREKLAGMAALHSLPEGFRGRIAAVAEHRDGPHWRSLAAGVALGLLAAGVPLLALRGGPDPVATQLVASHMRGTISGHPVDVASSDRHTVKPWLAERLPVSPLVADLAGEGYPLLGGRIDIIGGRPAPVLVFQHREHLVSVTQLPARASFAAPAGLDGYNIASWTTGETRYIAVSDLQRGELAEFQALLAKALAGVL